MEQIAAAAAAAAKGPGERLIPATVTVAMLTCLRTTAVAAFTAKHRPHHSDYVRSNVIPAQDDVPATVSLGAVASHTNPAPVPHAAPIPPLGPLPPAYPRLHAAGSFRERLVSHDDELTGRAHRRRLSADGLGDNVVAEAVSFSDTPIDPTEAVRRAALPLKLATTAVRNTLAWFDSYVDAAMRFLVSAHIHALLHCIIAAVPSRECHQHDFTC